MYNVQFMPTNWSPCGAVGTGHGHSWMVKIFERSAARGCPSTVPPPRSARFLRLISLPFRKRNPNHGSLPDSRPLIVLCKVRRDDHWNVLSRLPRSECLAVSARDTSSVFHLVPFFWKGIRGFYHSPKLHFWSEIVRMSDRPGWLPRPIVLRSARNLGPRGWAGLYFWDPAAK